MIAAQSDPILLTMPTGSSSSPKPSSTTTFSSSTSMPSRWCMTFIRRCASLLRSSILVVSIAISVVVVLASLLNHFSTKYLRASSTISQSSYPAALQELSNKYNDANGIAGFDLTPFNECNRLLFVHSIPNSFLCCDGPHSQDYVCEASFDRSVKVLSSYLAWIIPLAPLLVNFASDIILVSDSSFVTKLNHGIRANYINNDTYRRLKSHYHRLLFYFLLFLFRTFVLYFGFMHIEGFINRNQPGKSCWYAAFVSRCADDFDHSDHIILFIIHYLVPVVFEWVYAAAYCVSSGQDGGEHCEVDLMELTKHYSDHILANGAHKKNTETENITESSSSSASPSPIAQELARRKAFYIKRYYLVSVISVGIMFLIIRSMIATSMYFHTRIESITALAISLMVVYAVNQFIAKNATDGSLLQRLMY